jgi:hypothetical protein
MTKRSWRFRVTLALTLLVLAALVVFMFGRYGEDCTKLSEMKWPTSCIEAAEQRALAGDVRSMESLWLAYPNQGDSNRAYYWLIEAGRRGRVSSLIAASALCPKPPHITGSTVLRAIEQAPLLSEIEKDGLRARLSLRCP